MSNKLTNEDFCRAAKLLRTDVASIKAVSEVESRGNAFYASGFPVILFERHKFHKYTGGLYDTSHPEISNPKAGGYGAAGANQKRKFDIAFSLNQEAAMMSCSWGKFQIMGFNFKLAGFTSVGKFVDAMKESEGAQLLAFINFVINTNLADELRNHQWAKFAYGYNGEDYKKNSYDTKLNSAYLKFKNEKIDCSNLQPTKVPITSELESEVAPTGVEVKQTSTLEDGEGSTVEQEVTSKNQQDVKDTVDMPENKPYNGIGLRETLLGDLKTIGIANFGVNGIKESVDWIGGLGLPAKLLMTAAIIIGALSAIWVIFRLVHYAIYRWDERKDKELLVMVNTDINRKNLK